MSFLSKAFLAEGSCRLKVSSSSLITLQPASHHSRHLQFHQSFCTITLTTSQQSRHCACRSNQVAQSPTGKLERINKKNSCRTYMKLAREVVPKPTCERGKKTIAINYVILLTFGNIFFSRVKCAESFCRSTTENKKAFFIRRSRRLLILTRQSECQPNAIHYEFETHSDREKKN